MDLKKIYLVTLIGISTLSVHGQTNEPDTWLLGEKLPGWSGKAFKLLKLDSLYKLSDFINPYYIEADFNGDNKTDIAIAIEHTGTKKKGMIIIHQSTGKHFIIGAGKDFGNGGDNFNWMDIWKVYRDKRIGLGVGETKPVDLKTNAIYVAKSESSSAVIYWTGEKYKWYHQGD